jgi:transporter family protein
MIMWIFAALISASLLGIYDIFKKLSLKDNTVLPVLFFSTLTSGVVFVPVIIMAVFVPDLSGNLAAIVQQPLTAHLLFFLKSIIVGSSWVFAYFAIKHLPLTIVSPIRSSGPLWTLLGAVLIFGEVMNLLQWIGLIVTIGFYYLFSFSGKKEGISFRSNKWVMYMTLATIIGSFSSLFDKYLINHYDRLAIQCWFTIYMVPMMGLLMLFIWYPNRKKYTPFQWRHTIMLIGITLVVADFIYFWAVSQENALIGIISTIRRSSVIVSFSLGAIIFKEKNIKIKALILLGILAGIGLIIWGS